MKLYNSLTKTKEDFIPFEDKKVKMYVCGITPYDTTHLGHAFTYVFFDTLARYLTYKGYEIVYLQNVTDIDDDILKKAKDTNKDWNTLGDFWTKQYLSDMEKLNVKPPTNFIKATEAIDKIIIMTRDLVDKGFAYQKEGNVYFDINKFTSYGRLSHFDRNQMLIISRERGNNPEDPLKNNPLDFILWQQSKEDEPSWRSPWGMGRPGWHIECSALINKYVKDQIDIHGGGRDLVFPHHESEIAQSESYSGKIPFVKYWVHTAMLMYQGEKMSKSLGNLVMVSDLLKKYSADAIRFVLLSHHYRTPWDFDETELMAAQKTISEIKEAFDVTAEEGLETAANIEQYMKEFETILDDDLNTPGAITLLYYLAKRIKTIKNSQDVIHVQKTLKTISAILGFAF